MAHTQHIMHEAHHGVIMEVTDGQIEQYKLEKRLSTYTCETKAQLILPSTEHGKGVTPKSFEVSQQILEPSPRSTSSNSNRTNGKFEHIVYPGFVSKSLHWKLLLRPGVLARKPKLTTWSRFDLRRRSGLNLFLGLASSRAWPASRRWCSSSDHRQLGSAASRCCRRAGTGCT